MVSSISLQRDMQHIQSAGTGGGAGRPPGMGGAAVEALVGTGHRLVFVYQDERRQDQVVPAGGLRATGSSSSSPSETAGGSSAIGVLSSDLRGPPKPGKGIIMGTGGA